MTGASTLQLVGAGGFGALLGWYVYYVNRHRREEVKLGDLVTLVGVIGGGAVLTLFPEETDLFGAYGIGLFLGFFGYFAFLLLLVKRSSFTLEWFLDGRRPELQAGMAAKPEGEPVPMEDGGHGVND
jgi:hypothetical protein